MPSKLLEHLNKQEHKERAAAALPPPEGIFSNLLKSLFKHTVSSLASNAQQSDVSKINFEEYEVTKEQLKSLGYQYECKVCNKKIAKKDDLIHVRNLSTGLFFD